MENLTHILVFKTSIKTNDDKISIGELLSMNKAIEEWSVDCDDIDCVLRIVSYELNAESIIKLVNQKGFHCEELTE